MAESKGKSFTVRAAGADRTMQKFILGKFPNAIPDLRGGGAWHLARQERAGSEELALAGPGDARFRGAPEGSLAGSAPSNFFILVRQKGADEFVAIPVNEWATFKLLDHRPEQTLEDAEAAMKHQRVQAERAAQSRLAQAIASAGLGDEEQLPAGSPDDGADSDAEWEGIKARAATAVARAAPGGTGTAGGIAGGAAPGVGLRRPESHVEARPPQQTEEDDEGPINIGDPRATFYVPRPRDAEDWEHVDEAADDDLDMGDAGSEEIEGGPFRGRASPSASDGEGEEGGGSRGGPADVDRMKRKLKKMMRSTGIADSDGGESEEEEDEEEEIDVEDEDDLDKLASEVLPGMPAAREPVGAAQRKRKSPPPQSLASGVGGAATAAADAGAPPAQAAPSAGAKRPRVQPPPLVGGAAQPPQGPPTAEEVSAFLKTRKRVLLKEITAAFVHRLPTLDARKAFSQLVKGVARLDPTPDPVTGSKYLVPK